MTQKRPPLKKFDKLAHNAPVLKSLASMMEVELAVNPDGKAMVIITRNVPLTYWWAEYDVDLKQLYFITVRGQIQGLGMIIHPPFEENMMEAKDLQIVQFNKVTGKTMGLPYIVPLVVRKGTLQDI